jgi:glucokinase
MPSPNKETMILAGDIGGTKTSLGLFVMGRKRPFLRKTESFPSREAPDLEHIIGRFLDIHPLSIRTACFGVAGPVVNGRCKTTNLPWDVSEKNIGRRFHWPQVRLINDLAAMAMAVPLLTRRELFPLNRVNGQKRGNIALVAPGTGLGQALLIFVDGRYVPIPSEGGHVDFAPTGEDQIALWRTLRRRWTHVSNERLLSGPGLYNIYAWLKETGRCKEPLFLSKMLEAMDPSRAITRAALERKSPLAVKSLEMFTSILGSVCGNLALTGMTTGGVYLGGGIPPKILPALREPHFLRAFTDKGRFGALMEKTPVRVILNEKAALLGAAYCAFTSV